MQSRGIFCTLCALLFAFTTSHAQQWDWIQRLSSESSGTAIGVDGNQNVYVAGNFRETNYLGTNRLASAGGLDVFLAKLNRDGEVIWTISAGGPGDDSIGRLAVATNGALFVVGNFTIPAALLGASASNHSQDVSNVFVARVDDGRFTWFETLPAETDGIGGGVAFAPDESVWAVGATNGVFFFKKYAQSGAVMNSFTISNYYRPTGLAVNCDEQLFVSDLYSVSRVDFPGERRWQWSPGDGYPERNIVSDIKCTPEETSFPSEQLTVAFATEPTSCSIRRTELSCGKTLAGVGVTKASLRAMDLRWAPWGHPRDGTRGGTLPWSTTRGRSLGRQL
jgi:hypothetical protein